MDRGTVILRLTSGAKVTVPVHDYAMPDAEWAEEMRHAVRRAAYGRDAGAASPGANDGD